MKPTPAKFPVSIILIFATIQVLAGQEKSPTAEVRLNATAPLSSNQNMPAVAGQQDSSSADANSGVVTLDALIAEVLENNPEVLAARRKFDAATKRPSQASALPDHKLNFTDYVVGHRASTLNRS